MPLKWLEVVVPVLTLVFFLVVAGLQLSQPLQRPVIEPRTFSRPLPLHVLPTHITPGRFTSLVSRITVASRPWPRVYQIVSNVNLILHN